MLLLLIASVKWSVKPGSHAVVKSNPIVNNYYLFKYNISKVARITSKGWVYLLSLLLHYKHLPRSLRWISSALLTA